MKKIVSNPPKNNKQMMFLKILNDFNQDISDSLMASHLLLLGLGGKIGPLPLVYGDLQKELAQLVNWKGFSHQVNFNKALNNWSHRTLYYRAHAKWEHTYEKRCADIDKKKYDPSDPIIYVPSFIIESQAIRNTLMHGLCLDKANGGFKIELSSHEAQRNEMLELKKIASLINNPKLFIKSSQLAKNKFTATSPNSARKYTKSIRLLDGQTDPRIIEMSHLLGFFIAISRSSTSVLEKITNINTEVKNISFKHPPSLGIKYDSTYSTSELSRNNQEYSDIIQWYYYSTVVNFIQFWENTYRKYFAQEYTPDKKVRQIQSSFFFHLTKIRNSIVHEDGYHADPAHANFFSIPISTAGRYIIGFKELMNIFNKDIDVKINPNI